MTRAIALLAWETGIDPMALIATADDAPGVFEAMLDIRAEIAKKKGRR